MSSIGLFAMIIGAIIRTEDLTLLKIVGGVSIIIAVTIVSYNKNSSEKGSSTKLLIQDYYPILLFKL